METKVPVAGAEVEKQQGKVYTVAKPISRVRSVAFWVLFFGYAFFSLAGWIRMIAVIVDWYWLSYGGVWPGSFYLAVTGGLWGVAGMTAVIWLWLRRSGARLVSFMVSLFLALTYWADRLLVLSLNAYGSNVLFAGLVTLIGLAFSLVVLRPMDEFRAFFRR